MENQEALDALFLKARFFLKQKRMAKEWYILEGRSVRVDEADQDTKEEAPA